MREEVIILAGGIGSRMKSEQPKQFITVHDRPVIIHALEKFYRWKPDMHVVVVMNESFLDHWTEIREQYFAGKRETFAIPLDMKGSPFQRSVWRGLYEIPYGETISYGELANRLENPSAVRAVGTANGMNPISIIVPCHRVIGRDGSLTGYGGGLDIKLKLLQHEGILLDT